MNIIKLLSLLAFVLLIYSCGTTENTINVNPPSILEVANILDSAESKFFEFARQNGDDPAKALELTKEWIKAQSNVAEAETLDDVNLRIKLKSGIYANYTLMPIDKDGICLYRGGGDHSSEPDSGSEILIKPINNKKVLIYAAAYDDFYKIGEMEKVISIFEKSKLKFDVKLLKNSQCSPEIVSTFGDYGLVILDTHGQPDGFLTGYMINFDELPTEESEIEKKIKSTYPSGDIYKKLLTGELLLSGKLYRDFTNPSWDRTVGRTGKYDIYVSTKLISGLPEMPKTVIFANCCYSGYGNTPGKGYTPIPIRQAFMGKNLISYYGYTFNDNYSIQVSDLFAKEMEIALVQALVIDFDSTKIANLDENNNEYYDTYYKPQRPIHGNLYLRHFNADDYRFDNCVDVFTDNRDGNIYKAVCIGGQNWMAENLRYNAPGSSCYPGLDCNKYGKLYSWEVLMQGAAASDKNPSNVQGICPKGWHIPSYSEWLMLINSVAVGGPNSAGGILKATSDWISPNTGAMDKYGFTALPGGMYNLATKKYDNAGLYANWWTTTELSVYPGNYYLITLDTWSAKAYIGSGVLPDNQLSCRCIKD
jgi:uncharacterized protein (TIGR02145 family)